MHIVSCMSYGHWAVMLRKSLMWHDDFSEISRCAVHPWWHWGVKYSLTDQTTKTSICCWIYFKNHFDFCSSQDGCEPCGVFGVSAGFLGLSCNQFLSVCSRWGRLVVREEAAALIPAGRRLLQHRQERHGYVCCHLVYCVYLQWSNRGYSLQFIHHLLPPRWWRVRWSSVVLTALQHSAKQLKQLEACFVKLAEL